MQTFGICAWLKSQWREATICWIMTECFKSESTPEHNDIYLGRLQANKDRNLFHVSQLCRLAWRRKASRTPAAIQPRLVAELNPLQMSNRMGYCKCGVAHCYDPLRLSLRSYLSHWVSGGDPILWSFYIWEVIAAKLACTHTHTHTSLPGVLLPPLSGEIKTLQHLHARVCARSGTCQMWDCNSATDRHVCSTVQDNASNTITVRGERLLLLVCIVGLASCSDHAEHC